MVDWIGNSVMPNARVSKMNKHNLRNEEPIIVLIEVSNQNFLALAFNVLARQGAQILRRFSDMESTLPPIPDLRQLAMMHP